MSLVKSTFDENACALRVKKLSQNTVENCWRIGYELTVAKKELAHGRFEPFVQEKCLFSPQTARLLMAGYEKKKETLAAIWGNENRKLTCDLGRPDEGYWIIPPEIYASLNKEFHFTFDPCPNPRPEGFDGLEADWEDSNWVNPPFWAGITAWAKKAIEEQTKGKTSVLILPLDAWVDKLLSAGAEVRPLGFHDWIHSKDKTRRKAPRPSFLFILRGGKS